MPIVHLSQPFPAQRLVMPMEELATMEEGDIAIALLTKGYQPEEIPAATIKDVTPFVFTNARHILEVGEEPEVGRLHFLSPAVKEPLDLYIHRARLFSRMSMRTVAVGLGGEAVPLIRQIGNRRHVQIGAFIAYFSLL